MLQYNFTISHVPVKDLVVTDALSRAAQSGESAQDFLESEVEAYVDARSSSIPTTERRMEQIRQHQEEDLNIRATQELLPDWMASGAGLWATNPIATSRQNGRWKKCIPDL